MFRSIALVVSWIVSIVLSALPTTCTADAAEAATAEPLKVVVLPARAYVAKAGLAKTEEEEEWSRTARANIDRAIADWVARSSAFSLVPLPDLSTEGQQALDEFAAVANLATTQFSGFSLFGEVKVQRSAADRELGPSLTFVHEQTGADYAIGSFAFQLEQSKGLAAVGSTVGLGVFAGNGIVPLPPVSSSYVALFLADLRTGELRWANVENGYEVAGFNFSDLREAESVGKTVVKLVKKYPEVPWSEEGTAARKSGPTRPVSPMQGEFAVQVPAGWRVSDDVNLIRATRDGRALNEMNFELRSHDRAFPTSGGQTTRKSTPVQLAEAFVLDLEKQGLADLEIIDVSTEAQLAGKPAFRVRYRYRLPDFVGAPRIELMAVGTAVPHGLLVAQLDAPQLGYFDKALPAFEESIQTIVLRPRRHLH